MPLDITATLKEVMPAKVSELNGSDAVQGTIIHIARIAVLSNRSQKIRSVVPKPQHRAVGRMMQVRFP